ncbi:thioredoxin O2, mitochondrial [Sesamum indicum]|uniref:Thioredoxin O2, mitochondrial n=1 Tax=Sesamum indicum TaxID=4182 RepID=A0A6I9U7M9_SESIN|nr:thioredoxin O2, mitochondrial [Sesamum indicum]
MRGASAMLRRLVSGTAPSCRSLSSISDHLILSSALAASCSSLILADVATPPLFITPAPATKFHSHLHLNHSRSFSSPPSADPSNVVSIESEEQFNDSLRKVQDESLPAIFYFTAVWCGPCRLLSPIIGQLSEKYPHVTTYKIDIDKEGLGSALSKLNIHAVPTLHFFQNGKKASEVIGADVQRLKDTMEALYK